MGMIWFMGQFRKCENVTSYQCWSQRDPSYFDYSLEQIAILDIFYYFIFVIIPNNLERFNFNLTDSKIYIYLRCIKLL